MSGADTGSPDCPFCGCEYTEVTSFNACLAVKCAACGAVGPYAVLSAHANDYQAAKTAAQALWDTRVSPGTPKP